MMTLGFQSMINNLEQVKIIKTKKTNASLHLVQQPFHVIYEMF